MALWTKVAVVVIIVFVLIKTLQDEPCKGWYVVTHADNLLQQFEREGFVVVADVFTADEIQTSRQEIESLHSDGSAVSVVDFVGRDLLPRTSALRDSPRLHTVLRQIFGGDDYRFCGHNDIGYERIVPWHKDRLNGLYRKYERLDPFSTDQRIVKVAIYLQTHENDSNGLHVVPGSHTIRHIDTRGCRVLHPKMGWVVIFDQRLTHRGNSFCQGIAKRIRSTAQKRILVSFGYGRNNAYTDQFEEGTRARQSAQLASKQGAGTKIV